MKKLSLDVEAAKYMLFTQEPTIGEIQKKETRQAFMAGAASVLFYIKNSLSSPDTSEESALECLEDLERQCMQEVQEILKRALKSNL